MSGPNFTPSAEVAEMNRIQYELEYTEGISQRMRVPETLKVASDKQTGPLPLEQPLPIHTALMHVPERIVVAGEGSKSTRYMHGNWTGSIRFKAETKRWLRVTLFSPGDDGDAQFSHPRDLDLIQSISSVDLINMKAPPRVLTLSEQPLDSLEMEQRSSQGKPSQTVRVLF